MLKDVILKKRTFSNGEFLNVRKFLKNMEFCVKTRVFKSTHFFERGIFETCGIFEKAWNFVSKPVILKKP